MLQRENVEVAEIIFILFLCFPYRLQLVKVEGTEM